MSRGAALGPAVTGGGRNSYRNGRCVAQAQIAKSIVVALGGDPGTFTPESGRAVRLYRRASVVVAECRHSPTGE